MEIITIETIENKTKKLSYNKKIFKKKEDYLIKNYKIILNKNSLSVTEN